MGTTGWPSMNGLVRTAVAHGEIVDHRRPSRLREWPGLAEGRVRKKRFAPQELGNLLEGTESGHGELAVRVETRTNVAEFLKSANHKSRANEQNERKSDFGDDQSDFGCDWLPESELPRLWPCLRASLTSDFVKRRAGSSPARMPAKRERHDGEGQHGASSVISAKRGRRSARNLTMSVVPKLARNRPKRASREREKHESPKGPGAESRQRVAPRAERMAISFLRARILPRTRLATLAQAMSKTKPTAPRRRRRAGRISPTSLLAQRNDLGAPAFVVLRIELLEAGGNGAEFGLRGADVNAGL